MTGLILFLLLLLKKYVCNTRLTQLNSFRWNLGDAQGGDPQQDPRRGEDGPGLRRAQVGPPAPSYYVTPPRRRDGTQRGRRSARRGGVVKAQWSG